MGEEGGFMCPASINLSAYSSKSGFPSLSVGTGAGAGESNRWGAEAAVAADVSPGQARRRRSSHEELLAVAAAAVAPEEPEQREPSDLETRTDEGASPRQPQSAGSIESLT